MSKDLMMHKGFTGSMEASIEDECLHGRILFIDDIVTYEGETVAELKDSFVAAVDRYIAYCRRTGKPANKPFSGSFNVRVGPELHKAAAILAAQEGIRLNELVGVALRSYIEKPNTRVEHLHTHNVTVTLVPGQATQQGQYWAAASVNPTNWLTQDASQLAH